MTYIYSLIDPRTNKVRYVGKSNNPQQRLIDHFYDDSKTKKCSWILKLKSLGLKPILKILEEVPENNWEAREVYWISFFRRTVGPDLTNLCNGGEGVTFTDEVRKKISAAVKGKPSWAKGKHLTEEHKAKLAQSLIGIKHSKERCLKNSLSQLGKKGEPHTASTKKKISEKNKGRHIPEEVRENLRMINKGKTLSEETKRKIGLAHIGSKRSEETKLRMSIAQKKVKHKQASEETKQKMRIAHAGENNPFFGKAHSEESLEKMRVARQNYITSPITKLKMSMGQRKRFGKMIRTKF